MTGESPSLRERESAAMNHLRYLALLLLFGFVPVLIVAETARTWLDSARQERVEIFASRASGILEEARERILSGTTLHEFAEGIVDAIEKRSDFESAAVAEILEGVSAACPGALEYQIYLVSAKEGELPWESARGIPLATNVTGSAFEHRLLADFLIRHRLHRERDLAADPPGMPPPPPSFDPRREEMVRNRLLGARRSISYVAESARESIEVVRDGRANILFWDFAYAVEQSDGARVPRAVALLFLDPEAFARANEPRSVVERLRLSAGIPDLSFELLTRSGDAARDARHARMRALAGVTAAARVEEDGFIRLLLRVSEVDGGVFVAAVPAGTLHADLDRIERFVKFLLVVLLALALAATLPVHLGLIRSYLSLRHQVTLLFLFAALPPLSAIAWGGLHLLETSRIALEEETASRIRGRVREADEAARSALAALQRAARAVHESPEARGLARAATDPERAAARAAFVPVAAALCTFPEVESCAVLAEDGTAEVRAGEPGDTVESELVAQLTRDLLRHVRGASGPEGTRNGTSPSLPALLAAREGVASGGEVLRRRGMLHRIALPGRDLLLFLEPLADAEGNAERCLAIRLRPARIHARVIDRFHAESEGRIAADRLRVFCLPPAGIPDARAGRFLARRPEAREFVRRIARGGEGRIARIEIDGEPHLAYGAPLATIRGAVAFGFSPLTAVAEEIGRRRDTFVAVTLLTLLAAALASLLLSRRILSPIRRVETCVRAVAEGDLDATMGIDSGDEFGDLSLTFDRMTAGLREKRRMSRYLSSAVLDEVKKEAGEGDAEEVRLTILFTDLRDFTGISESRPPREVIEMLNGYLGLVAQAVVEHGGAVDKFIGDAVMAVFPPDRRIDAESHERRAVACALAIREAMDRFNARRREAGLFEVECGIGLHTGEVIRGNVGSDEHRVDLTVIGDAVNLAARIESLSREGRYTRILLSEATLRGAAELVETVPLGTTRVRGKRHEVQLHEVVRRREDFFARSGNDR